MVRASHHDAAIPEMPTSTASPSQTTASQAKCTTMIPPEWIMSMPQKSVHGVSSAKATKARRQERSYE